MEDLMGGAKVLSIGVVAKEHKAQGPNKEKLAKKASRDRYREQLERDMELRAAAAEKENAANDVHPFDRPGGSTALRDRHNENAHGETYEGYSVGNNKEEEARQRREGQQRYLHQLNQDQKAKHCIQESPPSVKSIRRRSPSPEIRGEFSIGVKSTSDGEDKKEKAREFYQLNQLEIERRQLLKTQKNNDIDIDGRFAIGGDVEVKKEQQAAANRIYLEKLNKDLGDRSSTRKVNNDQVYVNKTGWSGLNIGGPSSDDAKNAATLRSQRDKQNAYKQALDSQLSATNDRQREERLKEREELDIVVNPPYLEAGRH